MVWNVTFGWSILPEIFPHDKKYTYIHIKSINLAIKIYLLLLLIYYILKYFQQFKMYR